MKVIILLCDTFPGLLPAYIPSYVSMFTRLFGSVEPNLKYEVFRTFDGEFPPIDPQAGLYLITGCNKSAYDDVPWIKKLQQWIIQANRTNLKLVGICFGHQIIAQALGGLVERAQRGWGTGVRESSIVASSAQRYFPDGRLRLLYNHHDQVTLLPKEATLIATSTFCPNESFAIGQHILTFQGHPEYIPEYAVHLLMDFSDDEPIDVRLQALSSIGAMQHQGITVARMILDFARL